MSPEGFEGRSLGRLTSTIITWGGKWWWGCWYGGGTYGGWPGRSCGCVRGWFWCWACGGGWGGGGDQGPWFGPWLSLVLYIFAEVFQISTSETLQYPVIFHKSQSSFSQYTTTFLLLIYYSSLNKFYLLQKNYFQKLAFFASWDFLFWKGIKNISSVYSFEVEDFYIGIQLTFNLNKVLVPKIVACHRRWK